MIWCLGGGHYRVPGNVATMGQVASFRFPPLTTVEGALESYAGKPRGTMVESGSQFAVGWVKRPQNVSNLLTKDHMLTSSGMTIRPTNKEVLGPFKLRVVVRSPFEEDPEKPTFERDLRAALAGYVCRTGCPVYLGQSQHPIQGAYEAEEPAEFLVPGRKMSLPIYTPPKAGFRSYKDRSVRYKRFDLAPLSMAVPEAAWHTPEPKEAK